MVLKRLLDYKEWPIWKIFIRKAIATIANMMKPEIDRKLKEGFVNEEMLLFFNELSEIIEFQRYEEDEETRKTTGNYKMFCDIRNILCTLLDEDTWYFIRFNHLLDLIYADQNKYDTAHNRSRIFEWRKIREAILANHSDDPYLYNETRRKSEEERDVHSKDKHQS